VRDFEESKRSRQPQTARGESAVQAFPASLQAALHRTHRPAVLPGDLVLGDPLQAAKDHRQTICLRQTMHLLLEDSQRLASGQLRERVGVRVRWDETGRETFVAPAPRCLARSQGDMARHAVQPAGQASVGPDAGSLLGQDEKGCLENAFGVVPISEHMLAHTQDHRPMPGHHRLEGSGIAAGEEAGQQLGVARTAASLFAN
jgi:hypothetical protein